MKRIFATLLSVCMVLSVLVVVPFTASAETTVGYVAPTPTVTKGTYTDFATLTALPTTAGNYEVSDAAGLVKLAEFLTNAHLFGLSINIYQTDDIDMSSVENFKGIGHSAGRLFGCNYDGQGYKISNLTQNRTSATDDDLCGMFGLLYGGTVRNVYLDETCTFTVAEGAYSKGAGTVVAYMHNGANVENCYSAATLTYVTDGSDQKEDELFYVGGIVGRKEVNSGTMKNLTFAGKISSVAPAGGIVGFCNQEITIDSCVNTGDVVCSNSAAGSILGVQTSKNLIIKNCVVSGLLVGTEVGLVGMPDPLPLTQLPTTPTPP